MVMVIVLKAKMISNCKICIIFALSLVLLIWHSIEWVGVCICMHACMHLCVKQHITYPEVALR